MESAFSPLENESDGRVCASYLGNCIGSQWELMLKQNDIAIFLNFVDVLSSLSNPETIRKDLCLELVIKFVVPGMRISQMYSQIVPQKVNKIMIWIPRLLLMMVQGISMTLTVVFDCVTEKYIS